MRRRDGPPGRLYKCAGLREIPILVGASPPQSLPFAALLDQAVPRRRMACAETIRDRHRDSSAARVVHCFRSVIRVASPPTVVAS